ITACTTDLRGRLCTNATTFACAANPFHALCYDSSATVFQTARRTAVTNCGDGTTTITEQVCADAVQQTCEGASADTFNALCIAYSGQPAQTTACGDNDAATRCYLTEQINACAEGIETSRCASLGTGAISTCAADPFATACVAGSTFAPYLSGAQGIRYTYCSATGRSATDELCASYRACNIAFTGNTAVPAGCGDNFSTTLRDGCVVSDADFLFSTQCDGGRFDMLRNTFCGTNENLFHASCTADYQDPVARNTFCLADPFHESCKSNVAYADEREELCTGDAVVTPHAACVTPALGTSPGSGAEPVLIPLNTRLINPVQNLTRYADSFLSVTITQDHAIAPALEPIIRTVDIPDTPVERPEMGAINVGRRGGAGTEANRNRNPDGYAFFTLIKPELSGCSVENPCPANTRTSQHAVILPTTNLGAPLTEAPATAVWPGHFSTTENPTQTAVDFYIDWTKKEIGFSNDAKTGIGYHVGTNRAEARPAIAIAAQLRLSVKFNAKGQLYDSFASIRDATNNHGLLRVIGFIG
ncbi:MAG: hypothetical protein K8953_04185, partial [Proteobacteria bacterium]|nr:hypothetical protein [Pseudomonadota bacterium]